MILCDAEDKYNDIFTIFRYIGIKVGRTLLIFVSLLIRVSVIDYGISESVMLFYESSCGNKFQGFDKKKKNGFPLENRKKHKEKFSENHPQQRVK